MPKQGILHDYDLYANYESSARGQTCRICNDYPVQYQWSDYSGEAMCMQCGAPYQLKWGSAEQIAEGNYPYFNIIEDRRRNMTFEDVMREYWNAHHKFVCYGMSFRQPGMAEFCDWLKENHPEFLREK